MNYDCYLASYPKSGNTWMRILLANLISDDDEAQPLNRLNLPESDASGRGRFDDTMGVDSSDLTVSEVQAMLPRFLERVSAVRQKGCGRFIKLHYANRACEAKELLPPNSGNKAIYLVRNPLSVAVSLACHLGTTPARAIALMADEHHSFAAMPEHLSRSLPQWLGSWSTHALSWLEARTVPVLVVRYEDLWADTQNAFARVAAFLGLEHRLDRVPEAVAFSRLDHLRRAESAQGFCEKPRKMRRFFRRGGDGGWRETLSESLVAAVIARHGPVMSRLGYLPVAPHGQRTWQCLAARAVAQGTSAESMDGAD